MEVLGIIPARGGSKGIPQKNLYPLAGQPLLWYSIAAAKESQRMTRLILTTDDPQIAAYADALAVEVPFLRPTELALDTTPTLPVLQHALNHLATQESYRPSVVVLLQPTAPLRQSHHIDEAVTMLLTRQAEAVVSVAEIPGHFNPHWAFTVTENGQLHSFLPQSGPTVYTQRQTLPPAYYRNGAIYVTRYELIMEQNTLYGTSPLAYIMPPEVSMNIDRLDDIWLAEYWLSQSKIRETLRDNLKPADSFYFRAY